MSIARTPAEVATLTIGKEPTTAEERAEWTRIRDAVESDRAARTSSPTVDAIADEILWDENGEGVVERDALRGMLGRMAGRAASVIAAVDSLDPIARQMYDAESLGGLQCREVEAIADVLRAASHVEAAGCIVDAHAHGDDDEGDDHHGRFLEIEAEHAEIDARISAERAAASAPVRRCSECRAQIAADDMGAGHGMCGSCVHDAIRSGWEPGADA